MKFLESCCGFCHLRTGTFGVGIYSVLSGIGVLIEELGLLLQTTKNGKMDIKGGIALGLFMIVTALLIYGTIKQSRYFLLPWVIYAGIIIGLAIVGSIHFLVAVITVGHILSFLYCVFLVFPWFCVLSYYNQLATTNRSPMNVYYSAEQTPTRPTSVTYKI